MLPKAVLSFMGRLVGTAAVLASPLIPLAAEAAETSDAPSTKTTSVARPAASHVHRRERGKSADKKAKKRGARHLDANANAEPAKGPSSHCDDAEVTTERASAKTPLPKQSQRKCR